MKRLTNLLSILILISCTSGVTNSVSNEGIDKEIIKELNSLEVEFIDAVKTSNSSKYKSIMSDLLIKESNNEFEIFFSQMENLLKENDTRIIDQYHIQNSTGKLNNTLFSSVLDNKGYSITIKPINKEAFLSLRIIEAKSYQYLMINLYSKYNNSWKLDMIKLGEYSIHNMNSEELFNKAKTNFTENNLINAANYIFLSSQVANPGGQIFNYKNKNEMEQTYKTIINKAKNTYKFPLKLESISTKPQLLNFSPQVVNEGIFPSISYLSNISISDTLQLRIENNKIHDKIGKTFNNIKSKNSYIIYKVMNEMPNGTKEVNTYTYAKKTN